MSLLTRGSKCPMTPTLRTQTPYQDRSPWDNYRLMVDHHLARMALGLARMAASNDLDLRRFHINQRRMPNPHENIMDIVTYSCT